MMRMIFALLVFICIKPNIKAQTTYENIQSKKLNSTRQIKVKLPENYNSTSNNEHPLIIVFDGDYMFEAVSGQIDYLNYLNATPKPIIVGVMQKGSRLDDSKVDRITGLPLGSGQQFIKFIKEELIPHLSSKYKVSDYKMAIGHSEMANTMNSFILEKQSVFQAYVNIDPDFKGEVLNSLKRRLPTLNQETYYYIATGETEKRSQRDRALEANNIFSSLNSETINYTFDDFKEDPINLLALNAIAKAFNNVFGPFKPVKNVKQQSQASFDLEGF